MALRRPALLDDRHSTADFSCGQVALDLWLREKALHNQRQNYTRTFVIADRDHHVVAFHSLCAGMIGRQDVPRPLRSADAPAAIPVALLARLAVDLRHQGRGLGAELIRNACLSVLASSEAIAFRAVVVQAIDDQAARFYARFHFRPMRGLDRLLILPTSDIAAALAEAGGPGV